MAQYFMEKEIIQQPELLREKAPVWQARSNEIRMLTKKREQLVLLGRGSSGNICTFASYAHGVNTGRLPIEYRPWLANREITVKAPWDNTYTLAFSASGQSTDVALAAEWLQERGSLVVGVTNGDEKGEKLALSRGASEMFHLGCGPEVAVPATKSYLGQLFAASALCGNEIESEALETADCVDDLLAQIDRSQVVDFFGGARTTIWIARGHSLGSALDGALKMQESALVPSFGYSSAEYLHGPVGSANEHDRAVIFVDVDHPSDSLDTVIAALLNRHVPMIVLANRNATSGIAANALPCRMPRSRWARAALLAVFAQISALEVARSMGINPDAPGGLKKVTETY